MKKISFILLALLCWSSMVSAQENNNRLRKKYRNLSFVKQEFEPASYFGMDQTLKSNFGAAFTVGRTFYLHKKPIAGLIRFGLDATWFDLNYTNYKLEYRWEDNYDEEEEPETSNFHQAENRHASRSFCYRQPGRETKRQRLFPVCPQFFSFIRRRYPPGKLCFLFCHRRRYLLRSYRPWSGVQYREVVDFKSFGSGDSEESEQEPAPGKSKFNGMRVYLSFRF